MIGGPKSIELMGNLNYFKKWFIPIHTKPGCTCSSNKRFVGHIIHTDLSMTL